MRDGQLMTSPGGWPGGRAARGGGSGSVRWAGHRRCVAVGGNDVIAVIGKEGGDPLEWCGDPLEWWSAIQRLASGLRSAS